MSELTPKEPIVNLELALDHSLTHEEYEMIVDRLGRIPSFTELGVYSVMWSEHCSYKNSIIEQAIWVCELIATQELAEVTACIEDR